MNIIFKPILFPIPVIYKILLFFHKLFVSFKQLKLERCRNVASFGEPFFDSQLFTVISDLNR